MFVEYLNQTGNHFNITMAVSAGTFTGLIASGLRSLILVSGGPQASSVPKATVGSITTTATTVRKQIERPTSNFLIPIMSTPLWNHNGVSSDSFFLLPFQQLLHLHKMVREVEQS